MNNKLDNFLLAILWLVASTLGVCFWFNIRFGFNIFSSAHWQHLAYMQASQISVSPLFYISMVISVIVTIFGLYLLIRPRFRKIRIPIRHITRARAKRASNTGTGRETSQQTPQTTQPLSTTQSATDVQSTVPTTTSHVPPRPPRLNISATPQVYNAPTTQHAPATHTNSNADWPEIREIFESAGYTVKNNPRTDNIQTALFAIGTNETVWIGAVGVPTIALRSAIKTLNQIFSDTLDDIVINVTGFVVSAPDASAPNAPEILTFDTTGDLRQYMSEHPNPPLGEDDSENFDAFSSYMSTVIEYLGKI